jgi:hypothetical protein
VSADEPGDTYMEEFVGWRGWRIVKEQLFSVNTDDLWIPEEDFVAQCSLGKNHPRGIPHATCGCGIYATKTLAKLRSNGYHKYGAIGQVSLWGDIIDGGDGYRAEFAYPRVIYVPYLSWKVAKTDSNLRAYNVPIRLLNPYTGQPEGA